MGRKESNHMNRLTIYLLKSSTETCLQLVWTRTRPDKNDQPDLDANCDSDGIPENIFGKVICDNTHLANHKNLHYPTCKEKIIDKIY